MATDISQRLREFRKNRGLSQASIASAVNMSQTTWSGWEREPPDPLKQLAALATHYNISADYLLGLIDNDIPLTQVREDTALPLSPEAIHVAQLIDTMPLKKRALMLALARVLADE